MKDTDIKNTGVKVLKYLHKYLTLNGLKYKKWLQNKSTCSSYRPGIWYLNQRCLIRLSIKTHHFGSDAAIRKETGKKKKKSSGVKAVYLHTLLVDILSYTPMLIPDSVCKITIKSHCFLTTEALTRNHREISQSLYFILSSFASFPCRAPGMLWG